MFHRLFKELTYGGIQRIKDMMQPYLEHINDCPAEAQDTIRMHLNHLDRIEKKSFTVFYIQIILYGFLYASLLSALLGNVYFLGDLFIIFNVLSGIIGSLLLILCIAFLHPRMTLYVSDAHVVSTLILAMLMRYKKFK